MQSSDNNSNEWCQGQDYTEQMLASGGIVLGEQIGAVNEIPRIAKQQNINAHRSDWVADFAHVDDSIVFASSMRGSLHYGLRIVRQDSFAIGHTTDSSGTGWLIVAIADGVSTAIRSHAIADYMTRQAVLIISETIPSIDVFVSTAYEQKFWGGINSRLVTLSEDYCKTAYKNMPSSPKDEVDLFSLAHLWATTLNYAVIQSKKTPSSSLRKFIYASIAGDSSAYVLNQTKGWNAIMIGKQNEGEVVSNKVNPLPLANNVSSVYFGELQPSDCFLMVTDGLGDVIGHGDTAIGGFFQKELPVCEGLQRFLHVSSVAIQQADDDRTIVLVR